MSRLVTRLYRGGEHSCGDGPPTASVGQARRPRLPGANSDHARTRIRPGARSRPRRDDPDRGARQAGAGRHGARPCDTDADLGEELARLRGEPWFAAHGAIVQELVPPTGHDLRLVVAGERVVGSVRRVAAPGEWRTNVALGARRVEAQAPPAAIRIALTAARAAGTTLAGIDMLPTPDGFTVLDVNGAVEITPDYRPNEDVFREAVLEIMRAAQPRVEETVPPLAAPDPSLP
jgi:RimK-like ATP-grasp domain